MRLKHISFMVRDIEKSIHFYERMAKLKLERRFTVDPAELAFMSTGDGQTEIEFIAMPEAQTFEGKGMFLCFEITDTEVDNLREAAKVEGLNPSAIKVPGDGSRYFYVYDPDGVSVQFRSFDH